MDRRTALGLLAVAGLTGCSLQPVAWVEETAEPVESVDPAVEVRPDFFVQTTDPGTKALTEGRDVGLRISTPHFDGVLDQVFVGGRLGEQDAAQARQDTAIRAPQRHELLAFTMRAGLPVFQADADVTVAHRLRVGADVVELSAPFGRFVVSETAEYEIAWAMFVLSVPIGEPVLYDVTDQEQTVSVNLITGEPVDDAAWARTQGFRERQVITIDPGKAIFTQAVTSVPPAGQEVDQGTFTLPLTANDRASLLAPWLPGRGWASDGTQWLRLQFVAEPQFDNRLFSYAFTGPETFRYQGGGGEALAAVAPEQFTSDSRRLTDLDVTFEVPATDASGTLLCRPVGTLHANYRGMAPLPAEFVGEAPAVRFAVALTPEQPPQ